MKQLLLAACAAVGAWLVFGLTTALAGDAGAIPAHGSPRGAQTRNQPAHIAEPTHDNPKRRPEHQDRAGHEPDRAVGVMAGAAAPDLRDPAQNPIRVTAGAAVGQLGDAIGDGTQPVEARAALPSRLLGQIVDHPRRLVQATRALAERDDDT